MRKQQNKKQKKKQKKQKILFQGASEAGPSANGFPSNPVHLPKSFFVPEWTGIGR